MLVVSLIHSIGPLQKVRKGANRDILTDGGDTALMLAIKDSFHKVVPLLLEGTNIDIMDRLGYTALTYAVVRHQLGSVRLLLMEGARYDIPTCDDNTALSLASSNGALEVFEEFGIRYLPRVGALEHLSNRVH